jgi:hypothetical protein
MPVLDHDDIVAAITPKTLPNQPPFPGGPDIHLCWPLTPTMWHCRSGVIQITLVLFLIV